MVIVGLSGGVDPLYSHRQYLIPDYGGHDAAAALVSGGHIVAAFEEERLSRVKHTNKAAASAMFKCSQVRKLPLTDVDKITIPYSEPIADGYVRRRLVSINSDKLQNTRELIHDMFQECLGYDVADGTIIFVPHHFAHAASTYYCSGFNEALVVAIDGGGDDSSGAVFSANWGKWTKHQDLPRGKSLGVFYSLVTQFLGYGYFDEYKVMGLAPYGDGRSYKELFRGAYTLLPDGDYAISENLVDLLCEAGPRRRRGEPITQFHKDIAAALQEALEEIVFHMLKYFQKETGHRQLCLAGGVAHNCTLNGKILYSGLFDDVFVQPAAHDAGLALGGALWAYYSENGRSGQDYVPPPRLAHVYLGTDVGSNDQIQEGLVAWRGFIDFDLESNITERAAQLLAEGKIIGWVQGRSEFGPRALGNRSILADPRPVENKDIINKMVKKREAFRPFAPAVLEEYALEYFEIPREEMRFPFMTFVLKVRADKQKLLGATTHVDGTARVQTVSKETNPRFWDLIDAFRSRTGVPVLLNTSFNNNAEPIVDSVDDAIVCFLTTDLHYVVIGDYLIGNKRIDRDRVLGLVPSLPAYGVLMSSRKYRTVGETYKTFEVCRNYDSRLHISVSPDLYKILDQADGTRNLGELLNECEVSEEGWKPIVDEVKALWSLRSIVLRPNWQTED